MAADKKLIAVTLQLEVKNGLDKNSNQKYKNVNYENLDRAGHHGPAGHHRQGICRADG
jgi:hypothetical protein